jgi:hypothetical protein
MVEDGSEEVDTAAEDDSEDGVDDSGEDNSGNSSQEESAGAVSSKVQAATTRALLDAEEDDGGEGEGTYSPMELKSVVEMLRGALKLPLVQSDDDDDSNNSGEDEINQDNDGGDDVDGEPDGNSGQDNDEDETYTQEELKETVRMLTAALKLPLVKNEDDGDEGSVLLHSLSSLCPSFIFWLHACIHYFVLVVFVFEA